MPNINPQESAATHTAATIGTDACNRDRLIKYKESIQNLCKSLNPGDRRVVIVAPSDVPTLEAISRCEVFQGSMAGPTIRVVRRYIEGIREKTMNQFTLETIDGVTDLLSQVDAVDRGEYMYKEGECPGSVLRVILRKIESLVKREIDLQKIVKAYETAVKNAFLAMGRKTYPRARSNLSSKTATEVYKEILIELAEPMCHSVKDHMDSLVARVGGYTELLAIPGIAELDATLSKVHRGLYLYEEGECVESILETTLREMSKLVTDYIDTENQQREEINSYEESLRVLADIHPINFTYIVRAGTLKECIGQLQNVQANVFRSVAEQEDLSGAYTRFHELVKAGKVSLEMEKTFELVRDMEAGRHKYSRQESIQRTCAQFRQLVQSAWETLHIEDSKDKMVITSSGDISVKGFKEIGGFRTIPFSSIAITVCRNFDEVFSNAESLIRRWEASAELIKLFNKISLMRGVEIPHPWFTQVSTDVTRLRTLVNQDMAKRQVAQETPRVKTEQQLLKVIRESLIAGKPANVSVNIDAASVDALLSK